MNRAGIQLKQGYEMNDIDGILNEVGFPHKLIVGERKYHRALKWQRFKQKFIHLLNLIYGAK